MGKSDRKVVNVAAKGIDKTASRGQPETMFPISWQDLDPIQN
jgi:hypothetical protein